MPPPYTPPHWGTFVGVPFAPAGPVGSAPTAWIASRGIAGVPPGPIALPHVSQSRAEVRAVCQNPAIPVLFGYVCAMAWGGQGRSHVASAWAARHLIAPKLNVLRAGGLTRATAYNLFLPAVMGGGGKIPGLGPAFFTKLLYFFDSSLPAIPAPPANPPPAAPLPPNQPCYILDQWAAKSVNLLINNYVVRMSGDTVANTNNRGNYAAFCWEVEQMGLMLGQPGQQIEERLFSRGGHDPWQWRGHCKANWPAASAMFPPYNAEVMHKVYGPLTGLPLADFI